LLYAHKFTGLFYLLIQYGLLIMVGGVGGDFSQTRPSVCVVGRWSLVLPPDTCTDRRKATLWDPGAVLCECAW